MELSAPPSISTPPTGLTQTEVLDRVAAGQHNSYTPDTSRSLRSIFRANVLTRFNAIIFICFGVLLVVGRWQDALFGFVAFANTLIGVWQEFRAKLALDRLALLHAPTARVRRDGVDQDIASKDVVLDDLLILRAGDQIPADATVILSQNLQLDESLLTGESDAVDKPANSDLLSSSVVVAGMGQALVTAVGIDSYAHKFATEAKRFSLVASELRTSVDRVLTWMGWIVLPVGLVLFISQVMIFGGFTEVLQGRNWVQPLVNTMAAIIAMIPLGLVLITSIAFAVGAAKLAKHKVLVSELPAVEILARVNVICLDKTGTLTHGDIAFDAAVPQQDAPEGWQDILAWWGSDPNANATARCLAEGFPQPSQLQLAGLIPFSSARKWSAASFRTRGAELLSADSAAETTDDAAGGTWVLGAPEMVLSPTSLAPGSEFGDSMRNCAADGKRTLVLARCAARLSEQQIEDEQLPGIPEAVALITLRERVRSDAKDTLQYFREQGVSVKIISGDNPDTVAAIAREVGLDAPNGFDARFLPEDEGELAEVLAQNVVFGRVTPEQKRLMVHALQSTGNTVAMTGDGVNDALAIKSADLGIAMDSGSAATKAVARVVLLDNQVSHLPGVVAEGRQVIANVERVSMLFLTKTSYATLMALLFTVLVMEFPMLPRQLSVTDGLTIGIPAFFLALLPNAQRYRQGFLRRSLNFAIPSGVVIALALTTFALVSKATGISPEQSRAGATIVLGITGIWVLSMLARPFTLYTAGVVIAMYAGLVLVFWVPFSAEFFQLILPEPQHLWLIAGVSAVTILLLEVIGLAHRRWLIRVDRKSIR